MSVTGGSQVHFTSAAGPQRGNKINGVVLGIDDENQRTLLLVSFGSGAGKTTSIGGQNVCATWVKTSALKSGYATAVETPAAPSNLDAILSSFSAREDTFESAAEEHAVEKLEAEPPPPATVPNAGRTRTRAKGKNRARAPP